MRIGVVVFVGDGAPMKKAHPLAFFSPFIADRRWSNRGKKGKGVGVEKKKSANLCYRASTPSLLAFISVVPTLHNQRSFLMLLCFRTALRRHRKIETLNAV
jgi:hypothetical protein